jgi:polyhydroxyalkanoate synthesis regulator phasin
MNLKKIEKGIYISVGLASLAKKEIDKNVNRLVKEGKLKTAGARRIANKVTAEAKKEGKKIEKFLMNELKKEYNKTKPYIKKIKSKKKKIIKKRK